MVKRLYITASNSYQGDKQIVPVNTNKPLVIDSPIGSFALFINIKHFDGSIPHLSNSLYNLDDDKLLDGEPSENKSRLASPGLTEKDLENLEFNVIFTPSKDISATDVLFGNDTLTPVRNVIPVAILLTGLKIFTWFINKTVKADIYSDNPYLYGLAINSFTSMNIADEREVRENTAFQKRNKENLATNPDSNPGFYSKIPSKSTDRMKFFLDVKHCEKFIFKKDTSYSLGFSTKLIKMADSKYAISLPTWGSRTFDIDVSSYANDELNNFNWVIKAGGYDGVGTGELGLVVNFALLDEEKDRT